MKTTLTFLFCLFILCTYGQSNFVNGVVTTLKGEQIQGQIDYREWNTNPRKIAFKNAEGKIVSYTTKELAGFRINYKNEIYQRFEVMVNDEEINKPEDFVEYPSPKEIQPLLLRMDTLFLQTLVRGRINLFTLYDERSKLHFFIQKNNGPIRELIFRKVKAILTPGDYLYSGNANTSAKVVGVIPLFDFREMLHEITYDYPELGSDIDKAFYTFGLATIIQDYNQHFDQLTYIKAKDKSDKFMYFFGGAYSERITMREDLNPIMKGFPSSNSASLGMGLELAFIRSNNRTFVGFEANYMTTKNSISTDYTYYDAVTKKRKDYDLNLQFIRFNTFFKYAFFRNKTTTGYVKAGVGLSSSIRKNLLIQEYDIVQGNPVLVKKTNRNLSNGELSFLGGIGMKHKNLYCEFRYENGTDQDNFTTEDLKINRFGLHLGYSISFKKQNTDK